MKIINAMNIPMIIAHFVTLGTWHFPNKIMKFEFSSNPGPFSSKEHVLVKIRTRTCSFLLNGPGFEENSNFVILFGKCPVPRVANWAVITRMSKTLIIFKRCSCSKNCHRHACGWSNNLRPYCHCVKIWINCSTQYMDLTWRMRRSFYSGYNMEKGETYHTRNLKIR